MFSKSSGIAKTLIAAEDAIVVDGKVSQLGLSLGQMLGLSDECDRSCQSRHTCELKTGSEAACRPFVKRGACDCLHHSLSSRLLQQLRFDLTSRWHKFRCAYNSEVDSQFQNLPQRSGTHRKRQLSSSNGGAIGLAFQHSSDRCAAVDAQC